MPNSRGVAKSPELMLRRKRTSSRAGRSLFRTTFWVLDTAASELKVKSGECSISKPDRSLLILHALCRFAGRALSPLIGRKYPIVTPELKLVLLHLLVDGGSHSASGDAVNPDDEGFDGSAASVAGVRSPVSPNPMSNCTSQT